MRKRDLAVSGAPFARCAQGLSSLRVACVALAMLAANLYITRTGTFEPCHVSWHAGHLTPGGMHLAGDSAFARQ